MLNFNLKNDKWILYYSRPYNILMADLQYSSYDKYVEQEYGFKMRNYNTFMINNDWFVPSMVADELVKKMKERIKKDDSALEHYYHLTEKRCLNLVKDIKKETRNKQLKRLSNKELLKLLSMLLDKICIAVPHFWIPWIITENNLITDELIKIIDKNIKDKEKSENLVSDLLKTGVKDNNLTKEIKELIKLSRKIYKDLGGKVSISSIKNIIRKKYKKEFNEHIKKYSFLNILSFEFRDPHKEEYYLERIKDNINDDNLTIPKQKANPFEDKLDKKSKYLLDWARRYAYILNVSVEQIYYSIHLIHPLFIEAAKRLKVPINDLKYLLIKEVEESLKKGELGKDLVEKIKKRKKGHVFYLIDHEIGILTGNDYIKMKNRFSKAPKEKVLEEKKNILKGVIGNKGYAKGKVSVIFENKEIRKVKKNDILVCTMTSPTFVPAMEKAGAIVTDEGGLLCHAAIVAREMNKPCIINTKIATKVLKNGDLVEVDANKGTVRVLNNE